MTGEEYIEGMVAFGIPVKAYSRNVQAAIWAVGLSRQVSNGSSVSEITELLQELFVKRSIIEYGKAKEVLQMQQAIRICIQ